MPRPKVAPLDARKEMARRHLHVFGPATPASFADWAGIGPRQAKATYDDLDTAGELVAVRTPIADAWILASDEKCFRSPDQPTDVVRLLPSGDTYYLLQVPIAICCCQTPNAPNSGPPALGPAPS